MALTVFSVREADAELKIEVSGEEGKEGEVEFSIGEVDEEEEVEVKVEEEGKSSSEG